MRQRVLLVSIALLAAIATTEVVLNLQQPSAAVTTRRAATAAVTTPTPPPTVAVTATNGTAPPTPDVGTPVAWVLTARQAITAGTLLMPNAVDGLFERVPGPAVATPGTIATLSDLSILLRPAGRVLETTLLGGEPLLLSEIGYADQQRPSLASRVRPGEVAVAVHLADLGGLRDVVTVGDEVDILAAAAVSSGGALPPDSRVDALDAAQVRAVARARVLALGPLPNDVTVAVATGDAPALVAATEVQIHLYLILRPGTGTAHRSNP